MITFNTENINSVCLTIAKHDSEIIDARIDFQLGWNSRQSRYQTFKTSAKISSKFNRRFINRWRRTSDNPLISHFDILYSTIEDYPGVRFGHVHKHGVNHSFDNIHLGYFEGHYILIFKGDILLFDSKEMTSKDLNENFIKTSGFINHNHLDFYEPQDLFDQLEKLLHKSKRKAEYQSGRVVEYQSTRVSEYESDREVEYESGREQEDESMSLPEEECNIDSDINSQVKTVIKNNWNDFERYRKSKQDVYAMFLKKVSRKDYYNNDVQMMMNDVKNELYAESM